MKYIKYLLPCFLFVFFLASLCVPTYASEVVEPIAEPQLAPNSLYNSAYDLFGTYIYGATEGLTTHQDLTLTLLATIASLFVVGVPFIVVWFAIKIITR